MVFNNRKKNIMLEKYGDSQYHACLWSVLFVFHFSFFPVFFFFENHIPFPWWTYSYTIYFVIFYIKFTFSWDFHSIFSLSYDFFCLNVIVYVRLLLIISFSIFMEVMEVRVVFSSVLYFNHLLIRLARNFISTEFSKGMYTSVEVLLYRREITSAVDKTDLTSTI